MTNISVELVPRTNESLQQELDALKNNFTQVNTINIPDLLRYPVRSWEGCELAKKYFGNAIPHIRSMDFDLEKPFVVGDYLQKHGLTTVLLVTGDPPQDMRRVYKTSVLEFIRFFKREYPGFKVYASIDPYRGSFRAEIDYIKEKVDYGADGFFTQPFFDMKLLEIYADLVPSNDVYWGISPVMTDGSRNYWETKNNAIFPKDFAPTLDWNAQFAREALQFVKARNGHVYFMPIRANIVDYLGKVFA